MAQHRGDAFGPSRRVFTKLGDWADAVSVVKCSAWVQSALLVVFAAQNGNGWRVLCLFG